MIKRWLARAAEWDRQVSAWVAQAPAPPQRNWSYWLALLGAHLGDTWLWGLVVLWEWQRTRIPSEIAIDSRNILNPVGLPAHPIEAQRSRLIRDWFMALLVALGANLLIKQMVKRPRPGTGTLLYGHGPDAFSFPSGHAMRMGVMATWADSLWPGRGWRIHLLTLWVCWSRVRLGIHYVGDVLVGLSLGGLIGRSVRRRD
jgi:membrane-associated phospholipid phosphatase